MRSRTRPNSIQRRQPESTSEVVSIDEIQHALDREHYVMKQVKPVAEPVLATLGLDFERVIGDARQLDLLGGL